MAKKKKPQRDIVIEFARYFGSEKNLENWQRLCRDMDLPGTFPSIKQCRKALKGVWVNIWDFLDDIKLQRPVRKFPSRKALADYTMDTGRIYPKKEAKKYGPVKALLAHIFS